MMVDYNNVNNVKPFKNQIDEAYRRFVDTNIDLLENLDDDSEMQAAIQLYGKQTQGKLELDEYYRKWLDNIDQMQSHNPAQTSTEANSTRASSRAFSRSTSSSQKSNKITCGCK